MTDAPIQSEAQESAPRIRSRENPLPMLKSLTFDSNSTSAFFESDVLKSKVPYQWLHNLSLPCLSGVDPIYAETVALPEWLTSSEYSECGERTFHDGEWYFQSDKDGNQRGPFRLPLVYAVRCV